MKKLCTILFLAVMTCITPVTVNAEVVGEVLSTDIGCLIDNQPIKAYNINGNMYVVAEELRSYGFDVIWNAEIRTLSVAGNGQVAKTTLAPEEINQKKKNITVGEHLYDVYSTDIVTYVANNEVEANNIDGQTLIKIRDLSPYAYVNFDAENKLATVDVTKASLDFYFEIADKQELQIDENTIYFGEVKDGKPNGIGKLVTSGKQEFYVRHYSMPEGFVKLKSPTGEYYDTENMYFGMFADGKKNGIFYLERDIPAAEPGSANMESVKRRIGIEEFKEDKKKSVYSAYTDISYYRGQKTSSFPTEVYISVNVPSFCDFLGEKDAEFLYGFKVKFLFNKPLNALGHNWTVIEEDLHNEWYDGVYRGRSAIELEI